MKLPGWMFVAVLLLMAWTTSAADRPNIIFIITDDQRWDCLSVAGHPFLKTTSIDRIAREGAYFENAFVTLPRQAPSLLYRYLFDRSSFYRGSGPG